MDTCCTNWLFLPAERRIPDVLVSWSLKEEGFFHGPEGVGSNFGHVELCKSVESICPSLIGIKIPITKCISLYESPNIFTLGLQNK